MVSCLILPWGTRKTTIAYFVVSRSPAATTGRPHKERMECKWPMRTTARIHICVNIGMVSPWARAREVRALSLSLQERWGQQSWPGLTAGSTMATHWHAPAGRVTATLQHPAWRHPAIKKLRAPAQPCHGAGRHTARLPAAHNMSLPHDVTRCCSWHHWPGTVAQRPCWGPAASCDRTRPGAAAPQPSAWHRISKANPSPPHVAWHHGLTSAALHLRLMTRRAFPPPSAAPRARPRASRPISEAFAARAAAANRGEVYSQPLRAGAGFDPRGPP